MLVPACQVADGVLEAVLHRTERRTSGRHVVDRRVDLVDVSGATGVQGEHAGSDLLADRDGRNGDLLSVSRADLERNGGSRVEQLGAVELRVGADALDLRLQLIDLGLDGRTVVGAERAVLVLHGQLTHTLKHAVNLVQGALSRLDHRDGVRGVTAGLSQATDLATQLLADGEAGGVVARTVDAVARRQLLHRLAELVAVADELTLGVERRNVVLDTQGHFHPP
jgi:hypothetical protein